MKRAFVACTLWWTLVLCALGGLCLAYNDAKRDCGVGSLSSYAIVTALVVMSLVELCALTLYVAGDYKVSGSGLCSGECLTMASFICLKLVLLCIFTGIGIAASVACGTNDWLDRSIAFGWVTTVFSVASVVAIGD